MNQEYGPRRCRDTRKPMLTECPNVNFYLCPVCGSVYVNLANNLKPQHITCCDTQSILLKAKNVSTLPNGTEYSYQITGGYNDNTVVVNWKTNNVQLNPQWIYLKTFTGGYMKYCLKKAPMRFALADLDAFAYCDEDPCLECTFRCKRGFIIYFYNKITGLISIPLDKMSPYWQPKN